MSITQDFLFQYLNRFDAVPFRVTLPNQNTHVIGFGEPKFDVQINQNISKAELIKSTSLALGEAYIRRDIEISGDLYQALNSIMSQFQKFTTNRKKLSKLLNTSTTKENQRSEVSSHYDIGNDFYRLWLDPSLSYSCAYFSSTEDTLADAQYHKVHHILKKLNLKEGMSLLDIGCGWGYLLFEAAKTYHVKCTGITLSKEQYDACKEKIKHEHLEDYVSVYLMDYRDLSKSGLTFDRIVSVGMLEHVGRKNYKEFLSNVNDVLNPHGVLLLHYISALKEYSGDPWIKKYVFPGGVIPSLREILYLCADFRFYTVDVESLRRHYVKTLLCWRKNFNEHRQEILSMFDDAFTRMWELYLCSCAASFENGVVDLHQILLTKEPNSDVPLTRDYLYQS